MQNFNKTDIPKSEIKGGGFIKTDLNDEKLLLVSLECTIVGVKDLPHTLFATEDFSIKNLPAIIKENIYEVKRIILQDTFTESGQGYVRFIDIPEWLCNFTKVEYVSFENVFLDKLHDLVDLPIKHLIFRNIKFSDKSKVISAIKQFKKLEEISYDASFNKMHINSLDKYDFKLNFID